MAAAFRFAARKICGRAFQRPPQAYFTAAAPEEYRRVLPNIIHAGKNSLRRFSSSNHLSNNKHGASSSFTNNSQQTPWWSIYHPKFVRNAFLVTLGGSLEGIAIFCLEYRFYGVPDLRKRLGLDTEPKKQDG